MTDKASYDKLTPKVDLHPKVAAPFLARSLTTNHLARLLNKDTRRASLIFSDLKSDYDSNKDKNTDFCCPYCSQGFLYKEVKDGEPTGNWQCGGCGALYNVGSSDMTALADFMAVYGRQYYLQGKGVANSAYERHGLFADTDFVTRKQITAHYLCSKITLFVAGLAFIRLFYMDGWALLANALFCLTVFSVSLYYAYRGYCLATRQLFIFGRWHFWYWLKKVNVRFFLNIGRYADLQALIDEFEQFERSHHDDDDGNYLDFSRLTWQFVG